MYEDQNYPNYDPSGYQKQEGEYGLESVKDYRSAVYERPAPQKGKGGKILGIIGGGLLFGLCAGLVMIAMVRLAQPQPEQLQTEDSGPITQTEQVNVPQEDTSSTGEAYTQEGGIDATETAETEAEAERIAVVTDVTNVVDAVMPSVVSIFGTYTVTESFWGYRLTQEEEGSGSGIIVGENEEELLIVTNNHVVADSTSLSVQFIDDTTCDAVVKGTNADEDLAVISLQLADLTAETKQNIRIATLGDSDNLKVGEPAIAIGNALGYGQSVTTGVISAVNRKYEQDERGNVSFLIQTDAAINPGNSGGALLNVCGEVIGINSNKIAGATVEGMGYAIPISTAKPIIEELMSKKTRLPVSESKKGYLGISGINVTESVHEAYGLPIGVYLAQVFDGSPAQAYGLKKGDVIISFDGEEIETMEELAVLLDYSEAGSEVVIGIMSVQYDDTLQDGEYEEKEITVVLGARD